MVDILFNGLSPKKKLFVNSAGSDSSPGTETSPLKTIQKAMDAAIAGTAVYLDGRFENQRVLPRASGTDTDPIAVVGQPGNLIVNPRSGFTGEPSVLGVWKRSNIAFINLNVDGGYRGAYAATDMARGYKNILIYGCNIHDIAEDGIKISRIDNYQIIATKVFRCGEEGIDGGVGGYRGVVGWCEVFDIYGSAAGINCKGAAQDVLFINNHVYRTKADGIALGGQGGGGATGTSGVTDYQSLRGSALGNYVHDVGQDPLLLRGNHFGRVAGNFLIAAPSRPYVIGVGRGKQWETSDPTHPWYQPSKDTIIEDNKLEGGATPIHVYPDGSLNPDGSINVKNTADIRTNNRTTFDANSVGPAAAPKLSYGEAITPQPPTDCAECEARVSALEAELSAAEDENAALTAKLAEIHEASKP